MTLQQIILLLMLAVVFVLLLTERIRIDITAVLIIVALAAFRLLTPEEALSGFSSEPAIVVAAVFVLSAGWFHTGLSDRLGSLIGRLAGQNYSRMIAVIMTAVAALSAFTHHLTITAVMLPVTLKLSRDNDIPASKLLMPMSFAASLGTTITLIGAPAFLIADSLLRQAGNAGLSIFSIAPIGLALSLVGVLYVLLIGRFLLPARQNGDDGQDSFRLDGYYTEIIVSEESPMVGSRMDEVEANEDLPFQVVGWLRHGRPRSQPFGVKRVKAGDVLMVRTTPEGFATIERAPGLRLLPISKFADGAITLGDNDDEESEKLVQAIVAPGSDLVGRTLSKVNFLEHYGMIVVGLWRKKSWLRAQLSRVRLRAGDVLVLLGNNEAFRRAADSRSFLLLVPFRSESLMRHKAPLAGLIMLVSVLLTAFNILSVEIALLAGAIAMVLCGCLTAQRAYRAIDTRIFVFIAGAIPLGLAMEKTGTSALLAGGLQRLVGGWHPGWALLLLFVAAALITQLMSDAGTTALIGPVAISLAQAMGQRPEPFVVTVAMAAVASFLTPIGHHGNLLIYGPADYQFSDFLRVGLPLTILVAGVTAVLVQFLWPV
ncbi:MAG: SLC13 family permease [Anaerolineaceae bacterium]|nr:SLC13 family permease [Anaerolineaceae bacterium]